MSPCRKAALILTSFFLFDHCKETRSEVKPSLNVEDCKGRLIRQPCWRHFKAISPCTSGASSLTRQYQLMVSRQQSRSFRPPTKGLVRDNIGHIFQIDLFFRCHFPCHLFSVRPLGFGRELFNLVLRNPSNRFKTVSISYAVVRC